MACGCHCLRMIRNPLTFQVTCFWILAMCSRLANLKRNLFGPKIAKEKGAANSQAFKRAANTDWLLRVLIEMTCPTKSRHASVTVSAERDTRWDEGSSHERALVLAIRLSISMRKKQGEETKGIGVGKTGKVNWQQKPEDNQTKDRQKGKEKSKL